jgi:hypothetical protein
MATSTDRQKREQVFACSRLLVIFLDYYTWESVGILSNRYEVDS